MSIAPSEHLERPGQAAPAAMSDFSRDAFHESIPERETSVSPPSMDGPLGFTLIEIMVVIVILGALAAIIAPRIMGRTDEAKVTEARIQMRNIETALKMYKLDNGPYPTTEQGLDALVEKPSAGAIPKNWKEGGYLEKKTVPNDPWGNGYLYISPGAHGDYDMVSLGADGARGGTGFGKDIESWNME